MVSYVHYYLTFQPLMAFNVPNVRQNISGTCTGPRHVTTNKRHFSFVTILLITYYTYCSYLSYIYLTYDI